MGLANLSVVLVIGPGAGDFAERLGAHIAAQGRNAALCRPAERCAPTQETMSEAREIASARQATVIMPLGYAFSTALRNSDGIIFTASGSTGTILRRYEMEEIELPESR